MLNIGRDIPPAGPPASLRHESCASARRRLPPRTADGRGSKSSPRGPDTGHCVAASTGTGKTHIALSLGLAACQRGFSVTFVTAAGLVHQLMEARDEKRLLRLQRELQMPKLLISRVEDGRSGLGRPARSCCSRCSASATNDQPRSSPRTCPSRNGRPSSGRSV
ncbi:ATP-binding protein [Paracraurococcus lichenis]|uniref:ATP-binding protein n=1 Tax=Paracraurococcus lichenis TaxID=3064888 RepID=A0ABT9ECP1_9PROT|nr:ATP-binding protein [Paracraurococcus sp. LOR1-02]MDO9713879.1 ATP-binding protein [Paracraurococcus sp. LOR1-02]